MSESLDGVFAPHPFRLPEFSNEHGPATTKRNFDLCLNRQGY